MNDPLVPKGCLWHWSNLNLPQNAKVRLDLLLLIALSSVVCGYALAGPFRLLAYFYAKPFHGYPILFLLFAVSTFFHFRWLQKFEAHRVFLLLIPVLGFVWLRLGYALYSESYFGFNMVLYGLVILLGMGMAALVKIIVQNAGSKRVFLWFPAIPAFAPGMVCGLFNQPDWMPWLCFALFCFICLWLFKGTSKNPCLSFEAIFFPDTSLAKYSFNAAKLRFCCLVSEKNLRFKFSKWVFRSPLKGAGVWFFISSLATLAVGLWVSALLPQPVFFESQKWHHDKVVFSKKTHFQRLDITGWKGNHWFYQEGINHFSTIDSWLYFEPFVQPAMHLAPSRAKVLIIGGENGMIANALRPFRPARIDLLPVDGEYLKIAGTNPYYTRQNEEVFASQRVNIMQGTAFQWLKNAWKTYNVIFIDVPDPTNRELNQYYSLEFYQLASQALVENGLIITQSGSPYFATAAFQSIEKTLAAAKFSVTSYHNQVLTLGEWAWTMGMKGNVDLKSKLWNHDYDRAETQWFNQEAMRMMLSFGKPYTTATQTAINTLKNPVIYRLYNQGNTPQSMVHSP